MPTYFTSILLSSLPCPPLSLPSSVPSASTSLTLSLLLLHLVILPSSAVLSRSFCHMECLPFHLQKPDDSFTLYQTCIRMCHGAAEQDGGEEREGDVGGKGRELPFNSHKTHLRSSLKRGLLLLHFCFLTYRFLLKHCLDPSKKKKKKNPLEKGRRLCAGKILEALRRLNGRRNKSSPCIGFSLKSKQALRQSKPVVYPHLCTVSFWMTILTCCVTFSSIPWDHFIHVSAVITKMCSSMASHSIKKNNNKKHAKLWPGWIQHEGNTVK